MLKFLYAKVSVLVKKSKVFGQAFFKRLAGCGAEPHKKHDRRSAKGELKNNPVDCFSMRTAVASDRGKNYFAPKIKSEIILRAFPLGTLCPCKRGRSLSGSNIKLSAFQNGTPYNVKSPRILSLASKYLASSTPPTHRPKENGWQNILPTAWRVGVVFYFLGEWCG